jgi:hypothetical protein
MYISLIIGTIGLFVLTVCAVTHVCWSFRDEIPDTYKEKQYFQLSLIIGFLLFFSSMLGLLGLTLLEFYQRMSGAM